MHEQFRMFAAYNRWANEKLYDAVATLPEEDYRRDVGAFFKSMNGTLNHLLVADRIWMRRFTGEGMNPDRLDAIIHPAFGDLRSARQAEDQRIIGYVAALSPQTLNETFSYTTITLPEPITQHLAPALSHFFNHQTHHRGQAHTILSLLGKKPPQLDLLYFQRSDEGITFA
ncbi:MAG: DinB family protein [Pseudomonadota bacterium]|nr:DinB family protein [Pseudomonadota bacterium]